MQTHDRCPHCRASLPAPRSRLAGALLVGAAWFTSMVMLFCSFLLGPAIMFVLPVLFASGVGLITGAHAWAFEDRACVACGKLVGFAATPAPARAEVFGGLALE